MAVDVTRDTGGKPPVWGTVPALKWRYGKNLGPTLGYRMRPRRLSAEAKRVVDSLNRDGAAITSVGALLEDQAVWKELLEYADRRAEERAADIEEARRAADVEGPGKSFIYYLEPTPVTLTPQNDVLARFALQTPLLDIANAYFGMYTRLQDANVWHTFTSAMPARGSQLWHRDGAQDRHIFKVFVYLSEVDEGAGPFTYAPGTHPKGSVHTSPQGQQIKKSWRTTDEQMAEVIPVDRWFQGMGPPGTVVIADTRGYHKGGECRDRDRILWHCMFTSPSAKAKGGRLTRPATVSGPLAKEQQLALAT